MIDKKQTNIEMKKFFKVVGIVTLVIIGITVWYISIPVLTIWYLYKKDKRFSPKTKLIFSIIVSIIFLSLGSVSLYSKRTPSLVVASPDNGIFIQEERILVKGSVSPKKSTISINGIPVEVDGRGQFSYDFRLKNENNSLTIEAVNNGKKDTKTLSVKRTFTQEELATIKKQKEEIRLAEINKIKERIQREIDSLNKPFDSTSYRKDNLSLQLEVALFSAYAKLINQYKDNNDSRIKSLLNQFEKKVSQLQVSEFPKIRKAFASILADTMWENNITVVAGGTGNKTITFTGGIYANNKNISDSHSIIEENLKTLRFTRANYKWYKYDEEYSYFDIKSPSDDKVIEL